MASSGSSLALQAGSRLASEGKIHPNQVIAGWDRLLALAHSISSRLASLRGLPISRLPQRPSTCYGYADLDTYLLLVADAFTPVSEALVDVPLPAPSKPSGPPLSSLETAILQALGKQGQRMTGAALLRATGWSEVSGSNRRALASMVTRRLLSHSTDRSAPGYGLPEWGQAPPTRTSQSKVLRSARKC